MARISAVTAEGSAANIKDILRAAHILLQPPEPLPTESETLRERVEESWRFLPHRWDPDIGADTTEQHRSSEVQYSSVNGGDIARSGDMERVEGEVQIRCLDILVGLQSVLVKEFWPVEARGGYEARDFILGTADLRLVRLLLGHTMTLLQYQTEEYLSTLRSGHADPNPRLKETLLATLSLIRPTPTPSLPGPSAPRQLPPTTITQIILTTHLPPILLSCILLGYTPSLPPTVHADLRRSFLAALAQISPAQAISALSSIRPVLQPSKSVLSQRYPDYIQHTINRQLSAQILRPSGPLGLLLNLFGERALSDAEGVNQKKVDHATAALTRLPSGVDEEKYVRHVVEECVGMLGVPREGQSKAPRAFRIVGTGVIGNLVARYEVAEKVMRDKLQSINTEEDGVHSGHHDNGEANWKALEMLDTIVNHLDPADIPVFLERTVRRLLPGLLRLLDHDTSASKSPSINGTGDIRTRTSELAEDILSTWFRVMPPDPIGEISAVTDPGDLERLDRTLSRLRVSASNSGPSDPQTELDDLTALFSPSSDPPARVQAISRLSNLISDPSFPPDTVRQAVDLLVKAVADEEDFVRDKAFSVLDDLGQGKLGSEVLEQMRRARDAHIEGFGSGTRGQEREESAKRTTEALDESVRRMEHRQTAESVQ